jgi:hypothetical protein
VVVAGKGHETGQQVGDVTLPFDDAAELATAIATAMSCPASIPASAVTGPDTAAAPRGARS